MKNNSLLLLLFLTVNLVLNQNQGFSQNTKVFIKTGFSPLHRSGQSDFISKKMPFQVGFQAVKGHLGFDLTYETGGQYRKENFSFNHSLYSLGVNYLLKSYFEDQVLNPYVGVSLNLINTKFTTEGYPGITSYTHKIEKDKGLGGSAFAGVYYPFKSILLGLNTQFSKNPPARFLAGGFSKKALITDFFKLNITASIPFKLRTKTSRRAQNACPEYL